MKRILSLLLPVILSAAPAQVILIRNAEKPSSGNSLSLKGRERAAALVPFFQGNPAVLAHGLPTAIYAAQPTAEQPTMRAIQTVNPLAEDLRLDIETHYSTGQAKALVHELLKNPDYEGKMILVCWANTEIPTIASLLGAQKAPKKWNDDIYDRLWILNFDDQDNVTSFQNLPQKLLYGDTSK